MGHLQLYLCTLFGLKTFCSLVQGPHTKSDMSSVFAVQDIPSHEFDIGMKFEAVDQTNPSIMTVATVTQVVGRTMWVLLDGYKDDSIEHIYDVQSFDLFPVGWCSMNGHPLLTPRVQRKWVIL